MTCPLQSPFASFGLVLMETIYLMLKSKFNYSAAAQTHKRLPITRFEWGVYFSKLSLGGTISHISAAHKGLEAQRGIV